MSLHGTPVELLNMDFSTTLYSSNDIDTAMDGYDADISSLNTAVAGKLNTPTGTTAQYIRGDSTLATLPVASPFSFSSPSRSLNTAFQPSTTRNAIVNYSVDIATSVSLSGGAVGTVFLEYADDSGFTTNVVEVCRFVNGNTGTLVIGLTLNQTGTANVGGMIPLNKYVRVRTANTTGTPTFTYRSGQEVLL